MTHLTSDISNSTHSSLPSQPGHGPSMKKQPGPSRTTFQTSASEKVPTLPAPLTGQGKLTQKSYPCQRVCGTHDHRQLWTQRVPSSNHGARPPPAQKHEHLSVATPEGLHLGSQPHKHEGGTHHGRLPRRSPPTGWESRAAGSVHSMDTNHQRPVGRSTSAAYRTPCLRAVLLQALSPNCPVQGGQTGHRGSTMSSNNNVTSRHHFHLILQKYRSGSIGNCKTWCFTAATCRNASRWKQELKTTLRAGSRFSTQWSVYASATKQPNSQSWSGRSGRLTRQWDVNVQAQVSAGFMKTKLFLKLTRQGRW